MTLRKVIHSSAPDGTLQELEVLTRPGEVIVSISWGIYTLGDGESAYWSIVENSVSIWSIRHYYASIAGGMLGGNQSCRIPVGYGALTLQKLAPIAADATFLVVSIESVQEWHPAIQEKKGF